MNEQECLEKMVAPGTPRAGKYRNGVIQIWVTRACDKSCYGCTQGSNLGGNPGMITPAQFEVAVKSLVGYWGVVGVFGGNPAMHPQFDTLCEILSRYIPFEQRGLWSNNPINALKATTMRRTFNPAVSNLNVHLDIEAFEMFKKYWPESRPFGLRDDSRHSPVYVAMKDVLKKDCPNSKCHEGKVLQSPFWSDGPKDDCNICNGTGSVYDESKAWELISRCDINQHWSAMIGVFRNEVRAWFCEISGAQSMLHQHEPDYPDTGIDVTKTVHNYKSVFTGEQHERGGFAWWQLNMDAFSHQVRKHCHDCGVPMRGYGELAQARPQPTDSVAPKEQVSKTHLSIFKPKDNSRRIELVTVDTQLGNKLERTTDYMGNAKR
jgi:hypothetical protein